MTDPNIFTTSYLNWKEFWIVGIGMENNNGIKPGVTIPEVINLPGIIDGHEIKGLSYGCFRGNEIIREIILPETLVEISHTSIADLHNLIKITIPSSVEIIESWFSGHLNLENIIFSKNSSLTTIHSNFLRYCYKLKELYLPNTVVSIENEGFLSETFNMNSVFYFGTNDFSTHTDLLNESQYSLHIYVSPSYPTDFFSVKRVRSVADYLRCSLACDHLYSHWFTLFIDSFYVFDLS